MESDLILIGKEDALVVVDMQNDFLRPDGALYVSGLDGEPTPKELLDNVSALIRLQFGFLIVTADEHPFNQHVEYAIFGKHCVKGSLGSGICEELLPALKEHQPDYFITKGENPDIVAYSVATSSKFNELIGMLRKKGIKRIFVCGLAYTHCVGESAIAFASQGFQTYVVHNATRSVAPPYGDPQRMGQKLDLYNVAQIETFDIA